MNKRSENNISNGVSRLFKKIGAAGFSPSSSSFCAWLQRTSNLRYIAQPEGCGYHTKKFKAGLTLIEVVITVLLMSVIFLGISSLYVASRKFYITSSNKVIIGNEVQYAIQHIYKYVMQAIGDETSPPGTSAIDVPNTERVDFRINNNDPITRSNYSTVTTYSYYKSGNTFVFNNGVTTESLIPKVTVTAVNFTKSTNTLTGYITASYNDQTLTFYFACYPRLASFN